MIAQKINQFYELQENEFVLPQIKIPAYGVGAIGSKNHEIYEKALISTTLKVVNEMIMKTNNIHIPLGVYIAIDDDKAT